jgi:hypothetical protein
MQNKYLPFLRIALFVDLLMLFAFQTQATSYSWTGSTNSDWFVATNWSPNGIPDSSDNVNISSFNGTCFANAPVTIKMLTMGGYPGATLGGSGTITVTGDFKWTAGALTGTGALIVKGASDFTGAVTDLVLNKPIYLNGGGTWGDRDIIMSAPGVLNIPSGATFTCDNSNFRFIKDFGGGVVNIDGKFTKMGSSNLIVQPQTALSANGIIDVKKGTFSQKGNGTLNGNVDVASGAVFEISGGTTTQPSGSIHASLGTFQVNSGGVFSFTTTTNQFGAASVTAFGHFVVNTDSITISGDLYTDTNGYLEGAGSTTILGTYNMDGGIVGTGGNVLVSGTVNITNQVTLYGKITLNGGGTWTGGNILITPTGIFKIPIGKTFTVIGLYNNTNFGLNNYLDYGFGLIDIEGTFVKKGNSGCTDLIPISLDSSGTISILDGFFIYNVPGGLVNHGRISGFGTLNSSGIINAIGSTVAPGNSPGILTFSPSYDNTNGTLEIELAGTGGPGAPNGHDQLVSTGALTLGGTLKILLLNNYVPAPGTQFVIATAGNAPTGNFSTISVPASISCYSVFTSGNQVIFRVDASFSVTETDNSGSAPDDGAICLGDAATITATSGFGSNTTYAWSNGMTMPSITVSPAVAGTYNYVCTITYNGSCSGTVTQTIVVNGLPSGSIAISENSGTSNDGVICAGVSAQLTASGGTAYHWSTGDNTASITVSPAANQTYLVTITDANGCKVVVSQLITVVPNVPVSVTVSANPGTAICAGTSVTFTANPVNGGNNPGYQWYKNGNPVNGATNPTYTTNNLANNDVITVQLNSDIACTTGNPATSPGLNLSVTLIPSPSVTILITPCVNNCNPANITLTAVPTDGGANPAYQWFINGNAIPNATSSTYTAISPLNTDIFKVQMTSNAPCAPPGFVTSNSITALSGMLMANPVANQVFCNGSLSTLIHFTGAVPGTVYNWTNSTPSIGLPASGTGDITPFVASTGVAIITVTPALNGLVGPPVTFLIVVL